MPPGDSNTKLFINYRREDTAPYAGRLYDRLTAHFGQDQVFIDIDQIDPGEDFVEVINRKVGACEIAIVAIGPNWLTAKDASGQRRLDDAEDFVRVEITAALDRKIRVIPVLVGGARMPRKQDLPEALAPLSRRNAIELSETRFHADVNRLIEAIEKARASSEQRAEPSAAPAIPVAESVVTAAPESKVISKPIAAVAERASERLFGSKKSESSANSEQSEGSKTQTAPKHLVNDSPNYLAMTMQGGPIGLRYKVGFYLAAWILAFVATIPSRSGGHLLNSAWDFPRGLAMTFHLYYESISDVICFGLFFIHAVVFFRSGSRHDTLNLFCILFVLLAGTVAGWYQYGWRWY